MQPEMEPNAQHNLFSLSNEKYDLSPVNLSSRPCITRSIAGVSIFVKNINASLIYS